MERKIVRQVTIKTALYHVPGWLFFYYFWYRYFIVSENDVMANLLTLITTFFSALTFYTTLYNFIPYFSKIKKIFWFIVVATVFIVILSFARTLIVAITNRVFAPISPVLNFMGQFFISVFHISYAFVFATALAVYADKHRQQLRSEEEMKERLSAELEFLKNQLNPHFLFNIHNSIYFLIQENPAAAEKTILMLSGIMRNQLYECNDTAVLLEKELQNISTYIELEKIRTGNKIKIDYSPISIEADFRIAPFILLTLVENAFKHISAFSERANFIRVEACVQENNFHFSVVNSAEENQGANNIMPGIGLKNLLRRLQLIYGNSFELSLSNKNNIFSAYLKLPRL